MNKVLYLHGLNSSLHQDRREVLEKYGLEIFAPQVDYEGNPNALQELLDSYEVDLVVGSSAGGLGGYYFSGVKQLPALLFNPALPFRHYMKYIPDLPRRTKFLQIVLGARDEDVPPQKSFDFLTREFDKEVPMEIHWQNRLEHRIPIDVFEQELIYFLNKINSTP